MLIKSLMFGAFLSLGAGARRPVSFEDDFASGVLDANKWTVATYKSPDSARGVNAGIYVPTSIDVSQGMLRISVKQQKAGSGVESFGGALISKELFGYGTFDFVMRMSSTSPTASGEGAAKGGAVSSGFLYRSKSETEIDLEFLSNENALWVSTWNNTTPEKDPIPLQKISNRVNQKDLSLEFHDYSLVWTPKAVEVYIDGRRVSRQTEHVPQKPAHIILQHRGTNSDRWGGTATSGTDRYFFVRSVQFTPRRAQ